MTRYNAPQDSHPAFTHACVRTLFVAFLFFVFFFHHLAESLLGSMAVAHTEMKMWCGLCISAEIMCDSKSWQVWFHCIHLFLLPYQSLGEKAARGDKAANKIVIWVPQAVPLNPFSEESLSREKDNLKLGDASLAKAAAVRPRRAFHSQHNRLNWLHKWNAGPRWWCKLTVENRNFQNHNEANFSKKADWQINNPFN